MPPNKPPPADVFRTAADLRAAGNAWEAVADAVSLPVAEVRAWPVQYPEWWRKALTAAGRRFLAEATNEAILQLRKQLRADDTKTVREAALKLVQVRVALDRAARPPKGDTKRSSPPGYAERLVNYVRGLSREQLAAACAEESGREG